MDGAGDCERGEGAVVNWRGPPLTKLTLLKAASESLVQLRLNVEDLLILQLKMSKEKEKKKRRRNIRIIAKRMNLIYLFCGSCGSVVKNDLSAGENAAGRWKIEQ